MAPTTYLSMSGSAPDRGITRQGADYVSFPSDLRRHVPLLRPQEDQRRDRRRQRLEVPRGWRAPQQARRNDPRRLSAGFPGFLTPSRSPPPCEPSWTVLPVRRANEDARARTVRDPIRYPRRSEG